MPLLTVLTLLLMLLAVVLFGLSMFNVPSAPRFNFLSAGLFCWALATTLTMVSARA